MKPQSLPVVLLFVAVCLALLWSPVVRGADEAAPDKDVLRFLRGELAPEKEDAAPPREDASEPESKADDGDARASDTKNDGAAEVAPGLAVLEGKEPTPEEAEKEEEAKPPRKPGRFFGPLPGRNLHPLQILFYSFPAERARTLEPSKNEFAFRFNAANSIIKNAEGGAVVDLDLESWIYQLEYRRGTALGEFTLQVPVRDNTHGLMDNIIYTWHGWFGLPQGDRPLYPENDFRYFVRTRDGAILNFPSDKPGLGDVSVQWKRGIGHSTDSRAWSGRVAVKCPTGDSGKGLGSGDFDLGVGVAYERLGARWAEYANLNYIFIGGSDFVGLDTSSIFTGMLGAEYRLRPSWWLTGQVDFAESPVRTGSPWVDRDSLELLLGFHKLLAKGLVFSGGFSEDIRTETGPDFAVVGELRWRF